MAVLLNILTLGETDEYYETAEKEAHDTLPAGGLGVSPSFKNTPRLGDTGGWSRLFQQSHYSIFACSLPIYILTL